MQGVVSGANYVPTVPSMPSMEHIDLLAMLQPQAMDHNKLAANGIHFKEDEARLALHDNYTMRAPASDADGIPNDYGQRPIMMVIDGNPETGTGGIAMTADQYTSQILQQQQALLKGPPKMSPPAAAPDMTNLLLQLLANPAAAQQMQNMLGGAGAPTYGTQPAYQPSVAVNPQPMAGGPPPQGWSPTPFPVAAKQLGPQECTTDECGLAFLTTPASKPEQRVEFDLGTGGRHKKRYHHVSYQENCLSLIYDTRYDDDEFVPPATADGAPVEFTLNVPGLERKFRCTMFAGLSNKIGCMSITNLIVVSEPEPLG